MVESEESSRPLFWRMAGLMGSIATSASRILTMLPSTPQVESVYLDPRAGILAGLKDLTGDTEPLKTPSTKTTTSTLGSAHAPASAEVAEKSMMRNMVDSITGTGTENPPHTILIDQTTLDPTFAMSLAEKIQSETLGRALMLDAPVSGGTFYLERNKEELISRNDGCCQWGIDHHVWFTVRFGLQSCCPASAAYGSGWGSDPLWEEWDWGRGKGLQQVSHVSAYRGSVRHC